MKDFIYYNHIFEIFKKEENTIESFGRSLGKVAYGEECEIKLKNSVKMLAAKLFKKEKDYNIMSETMIAKKLKEII